jgi:uncharacterized protein
MLRQSAQAPALVSIHDVMPHNLQAVGELLGECRRGGIGSVTLLVVPGLDWSQQQLSQLWQWQSEGCILAGHGWSHRTESVRSLYHWLHSILLSRDVAEHLSLTGEQIVALVSRCGQWFVERGFEHPTLYVPPAWAVGQLPPASRRGLAFSMLETLTGVALLRAGRHIPLPLVGFEADTAFRSFFLRRWNGWTIRSAVRHARMLRISLHPTDHRLLLRDDLQHTLAMGWASHQYDDLESWKQGKL